jgi:hypothetical protein
VRHLGIETQRVLDGVEALEHDEHRIGACRLDHLIEPGHAVTLGSPRAR